MDIIEEKKLINETCIEKNITKDDLENKLILLILSKMVENKDINLDVSNDKVKEFGIKLEQYYKDLGFNCNNFSNNYNDLKLHIIVETLKNNYGTINNNYNTLNLDIQRYEIIKNKKEFKKIASIVDKSYEIITGNILNKKEQNLITNKQNIEILIENIDMINLVTNPLDLEFITLKEYNNLFIDYQKYFKQKIKEILYLEYLEDRYTNIDITRYTKDNYGSSLVINLEEEYGKSYKPLLFLEEIKDNIKNYIWDKSKIIKREKTLDNLFYFVDENESFFKKNSLRLSTNNEQCEINYNSKNEENFETITFVYNDNSNIITIKSNYEEETLNYQIYINKNKVNLRQEDILEVIDNIYISSEYLPKFIKDYINLKAKKQKRKERRIN